MNKINFYGKDNQEWILFGSDSLDDGIEEYCYDKMRRVPVEIQVYWSAGEMFN